MADGCPGRRARERRRPVTAAKVALVIVGLLAAGFVICPRPPRDVDPDGLLDAVLEAELTVGYRALRVCERTFLGSVERREEWVRGPDAGLRTAGDGAALTGRQAIDLIRRNYSPLVEGRDTIAGREVWTLRLKPHAKRFPWKQLWVDKRTHVVLAQREWDGRNKLKATVKTLSIEYEDAAAVSRSIRESSRAAALPEPPCSPRYVPQGFTLSAVRVERGGDVRLAYTDGLFVLTVRVLDRPFAESAEWRVRDAGQALVCTGAVDGKEITVVGDVPATEIVKVARSVR